MAAGIRGHIRLPSIVLMALVAAVAVLAVVHSGGHSHQETATTAPGHPRRAPARDASHAANTAATTPAHTPATTTATMPATLPATMPVGSVGPAGIAVNPAALAGQPAATALSQLDALGLHAVAVVVTQAGTPGSVITVVTAENSPLPALLAPGTTVDVQVVGPQ